jgi:heat shock protein HtpX
MKRIVLFLLTNILVMVTLSIVINILGVKPYLSANGIDYSALMMFCLVWGMGGAFISLLMSRMMAKWMMGVKVIDPRNAGQLGWYVDMVSQYSRTAQIPVPEIGVYESPEINGFATGPSQSRALVALSTGLLQQMNRDEVAGVVAHEIAHIKNGDMVTMTLIQGVMNAFVMFLARVIGFAASQAVKEENRSMVNFIVVLLLDILLGILGSIAVMWFSRQREFRADAGSAKIAGREKMIAALEALRRVYGREEHDPQEHASLATMKISGKRGGLLGILGSTHPSLEERIARLKAMA